MVESSPQPHPPTQPTWRHLIRLLLSYRGEPIDIEAIRAYQRDDWGSSTGETCVIELSGLAAPSMQTVQDRTTFLSKRIERIREAALKYVPEFIVMYGKGQRSEWERITQSEFNSNRLCHIEKTVVALAIHPVAPKLTNEYWVNLGRLLQSTVGGSQ